MHIEDLRRMYLARAEETDHWRDAVMLQTRRSGDLSQEEQKKVSEFDGFWNREESFRRFDGWLEALKTHDDGTVPHMTGCIGVQMLADSYDPEEGRTSRQREGKWRDATFVRQVVGQGGV